MGLAYNVECDDCKYKYLLRLGGGVDFYLLHCDSCGNERIVRVEEMTRELLRGNVSGTVEERSEKIAGKCERCDGHYKMDALPRCPKCKSLNYTEVEEDDKVIRIHYD